MPLDDRDRIIVAQVAVKEAITLIGASSHPEDFMSAGEYAALVPEVAPVLHETIMTLFAGQSVVDAFPGTTQDAQVIPHPAAQQQAVQNAPQAPAPIPGVQEDPADALWKELVESPQNFWDNRNDKRNPKAPDFKHKTKMDGKFNAALWLRDKPAWVNL